jgi:hypothetical protein
MGQGVVAVDDSGPDIDTLRFRQMSCDCCRHCDLRSHRSCSGSIHRQESADRSLEDRHSLELLYYQYQDEANHSIYLQP